MAYVKQAWESAPSGNTPATHDRLNHIEDGIEAAASTADAALAAATGGGAVIKIHGSTAGTTRPAVAVPVVWFGTVRPNNMIDGDVYIPVTVEV